MNRSFLLVLSPTVVVALGYILVLRALGMQPPYVKLAVVVAILGLALWWIGRNSARSEEKTPQA